MKKLALLAVLAALSTVSYAQKAIVDLQNLDSNPVFFKSSPTATPALVQIADGINFTVLGPTGSALTAPDGGAISFTWAGDGTFYIGAAAVPGATAGSPTSLTFRAWKGGTSFATSTFSVASTFTQATSVWDPAAIPPTTPAGPAGGLALPVNLTVAGVPEPTTIALGLVGAAALLLRRRK